MRLPALIISGVGRGLHLASAVGLVMLGVRPAGQGDEPEPAAV
ncbi:MULTISPECIES: hypothetical protein [unclassified Streptomyces]